MAFTCWDGNTGRFKILLQNFPTTGDSAGLNMNREATVDNRICNVALSEDNRIS